MMHQQWDPIVIGKPPKKNNDYNTQQKWSQNTTSQKNRKLERLADEGGRLQHVEIPHNLKLALQKGRTAKQWTQKDLALALNLKPSIINDYETGRTIPDNALISRMEKTLGVKLPRAHKPNHQSHDI